MCALGVAYCLVLHTAGAADGIVKGGMLAQAMPRGEAPKAVKTARPTEPPHPARAIMASAQVQAQIRALLLQRVVQEPLHSVRRAIADVVGAVARIAVPMNQWPGAPSVRMRA